MFLRALGVKPQGLTPFTRVFTCLGEKGAKVIPPPSKTGAISPFLHIHTCFTVLLADRLEGYVEITCHDPAKFKEHSTQSFCASVDLVAEAHHRLQADAIAPGLCANIAKVEGFNYHPKGLLYNRRLRDSTIEIFPALRYDWVHSAFQDGCMSIECHRLVARCEEVGKGGYPEVEAHLKQQRCFPRAKASKGKELHRVFSKYRANERGEHEKLKATASEALGMYVLLRHWVETEIGEPAELEAELASFKAACDCIDLILMAKKQLLPVREAAGLLRTRLSRWMRLHIQVYGEKDVHPKFHWMFDVCDQLEIDEWVFDQLIIERLHLAVKPHAERCQNTRRYERSVLSGVLNSQLDALNKMRPDCSILDNNTVKLRGFDDAEIADSVDVLGMQISVGDIVFCGDIAGRACACADELGTFLVIVAEFRCVHRLSGATATWRETGQLRIWRALELEQDLFPS